MADCMRKIMKLFLVLSEEEKTWEEVKPMCDALFHDEVRMEHRLGKESLNKDRIMADMEDIVKNKATMQLVKVEDDHESGIVYEYSVRRAHEKTHRFLAEAMIRDGKLYHIYITDTTNVAHPLTSEQTRRASAPILLI
jgi:hypothetical protein